MADEKKKILIVDDYPQVRTMQRRYLQLIGDFDIEEAENGKEALEKLCLHEFSLVLVDWDMPCMNGIDFIKNARNVKPKLPIIMVSSKFAKSDILEALNAGANEYITKPPRFKPFSQKVKKILALENNAME